VNPLLIAITRYKYPLERKYVGEVGYQTDLFPGGSEQVVIPTPWKIPGVKILGSGGLK